MESPPARRRTTAGHLTAVSGWTPGRPQVSRPVPGPPQFRDVPEDPPPHPVALSPTWKTLHGQLDRWLCIHPDDRFGYTVRVLLREFDRRERDAATVISLADLHALLVPHLIGDSDG